MLSPMFHMSLATTVRAHLVPSFERHLAYHPASTVNAERTSFYNKADRLALAKNLVGSSRRQSRILARLR